MKRRPFYLVIAFLGLSLPANPAFADFLIDNNGNSSVLLYNSTTNSLSTFVSSGSGGLISSNGMTYGSDGNLYVSNLGGSILEYNGTTGAFIGTLVAHTVGAGTSTQLQYPFGIAFDPNNPQNLYIANYGNNVIDLYNTATKSLSVYATLPSGGGPTGLTFGPDGNLYVNYSSTTTGVSQVREYNITAGTEANIISGLENGSHLNAPAQLAFVSSTQLLDSNYYESTLNSYKIQNVKGSILASWQSQLAGPSNLPGTMNQIGGVAYNSSTGQPTSGLALMTDTESNSLFSVSVSGATSVTNLNPTIVSGAYLNDPTNIIAVPSGITPDFKPFGFTPLSTVPEPTSMALFGVGVMAYLGARLRRRLRSA